MTTLSFLCIVLLPRQFHVTVVENNGVKEMKRAAWLFPLYLVLINLFVVPIAIAGLTIFPKGSVDSDMFMLALPLNAGHNWIAMIAFIGGLSAATAMVIVESVAVAIMVSNDLVVPLLLRLRGRDAARDPLADMGAVLLLARRIAIFAVLCLAYLYYRYAGEAQLAQIGLLSFAAIAQFGPAFFGGLFWRRATAAGAISGIVAGVAIWGVTLLLPSFVESGFFDRKVLDQGLLGLGILRPQALFGMTGWAPLTHGVLWSLGVNVLLFVLVSLLTRPAPIEKLQANVFVPSSLAPMAPSYMLWRSRVTVEELLATIARYLGEERTRRSFESFATSRGLALEPKREADVHLLRYAEHLLASAIGAASSRLVLSLLLRKRTVSTKAALKLLDDASEAIQYNREILQTALDHVRQGIAVFDKQMQLVTWNRYFGEMLELPPDLVRVGVRLDEILYRLAERGDFGTGTIDAILQDRLERYIRHTETFHERMPRRGVVIEVRANRMPDGGIVATYTDITPSVEAAEALERRVQERTEELTRLNKELARAKAEADEANISKTRFLAAASHDILQPLNAARLYATSLVEREQGSDEAKLAGNVDASLEAVEEILGALLDISRLDTGAMQPEISNFRIGELLGQLKLEFMPLAAEKGLDLRFLPCSLNVRSDRRLLRRLLQNLISNAIKYTPKGVVVVGCRRLRGKIRIEVHDTGLGIPASQQKVIFHEFQRLAQGARARAGSGSGFPSSNASRACLDTKSRCARNRARAPPSLSKCRPSPRRHGRDRGAAAADAGRGARRNRHALHRQRSANSERDDRTAERLGLSCARRRRSRRGTRAVAQGSAARRAARRLSPRQQQRHRGDRRAPPIARPGFPGLADHSRPHAESARGSARAEYSGAEQAAEARGAARIPRAMARRQTGRRIRIICHSGRAEGAIRNPGLH